MSGKPVQAEGAAAQRPRGWTTRSEGSGQRVSQGSGQRVSRGRGAGEHAGGIGGRRNLRYFPVVSLWGRRWTGPRPGPLPLQVDFRSAGGRGGPGQSGNQPGGRVLGWASPEGRRPPQGGPRLGPFQCGRWGPREEVLETQQGRPHGAEARVAAGVGAGGGCVAQGSGTGRVAPGSSSAASC